MNRGVARRGLGYLVAACSALGSPSAPLAETDRASAERDLSPPALTRAEARRAAAAAAIAAARHASDPVPPLANAIADYADEIASLETVLVQAAAREHALTLDLAVRRDEIAHLLATVQAMETRPARQTLHPQGPVGTARATAMMAALAPGIEAEGARLAGQLDDIARLRDTQALARAAIGAGEGLLGPARADLGAAMTSSLGSACCPQTDAALEDLLRESETLSTLARKISEAVAQGGGADPELRAALGGRALAGAGTEPIALDLPVRGRIAARFEAPDGAGVQRPGLLFVAQPMGLVWSPATGLVRYAGPFLDYRQIVVIEPRAETLIVIAGLAQLHVASGETIARGAFLGLLGGQSPFGDEVVMPSRGVREATPVETLYMELRDRGETVDPEPWLERTARGTASDR